ncbi:MAG: 50S ribosomal protein L18 [Xanthomonadaceae bacterium]|nr:50S ribosomal protein L18 [Xanthomonadaceae bacterium]
MKVTKKRSHVRAKKKLKIRSRLSGSSERPRLSVYRTAKHIYVQAIDDRYGVTLACAGSTDRDFDEANGGNIEAAKKVGKIIASRLLDKGVKEAIFDRNAFLYHGRIKALADAVREAGLRF